MTEFATFLWPNVSSTKQALAKIPYTQSINFGERLLALALLKKGEKYYFIQPTFHPHIYKDNMI